MKSIYKNYCDEIQNPALGAYLIAIFIKNFKSKSNGKNPTLVDVFFCLPLLIVKTSRDFIIEPPKISKMSSFYKKLKKLSSKSKNRVFGTINTSINTFKEYTMCSLLFGIDVGLINIKIDGTIDCHSQVKEYKANESDELSILTKSAHTLGLAYAIDNNIDDFVSAMEE